MRPVWLLVHRVAGLATAGFLLVAGLTGAVIAFHFELDAALNPDIFAIHGGEAGPPLPVDMLADRVAAAEPQAVLRYMPLNVRPGETARIGLRPRFDAAAGRPAPLGYDEVFVAPDSGRIIERRQRYGCCLDRRHLVGFLYRLHYTLLLPGRWGTWLMGAVAVIWLADSFIGAYLTLPRARPLAAHWAVSWKIKRGAAPRRRHLDLHRAGGLWFFPVLVMLAFTGIYFNLNAELFRPAVGLFSQPTPSPYEQRAARPPGDPAVARIGFGGIAERAAAEAARRGWRDRPGGISYHPAYGIYAVHFFPGQADYGAGPNRPYLYYDGSDGRLLQAEVPLQGSAADILFRLQFPLHSGWIAGLPGRILVSLAGLVTAMLSVTGIVLWWRRGRPARRG
ncbi:PepSY-associated TM helix domain-containing protein [Ferrovibrio sp.]|uniref:PepSY-associated TM helix domain-containing protein n=1 Tax=Ferrovibrio sp. TaxID=1917215 RepID=UPI0035199B44